MQKMMATRSRTSAGPAAQIRWGGVMASRPAARRDLHRFSIVILVIASLSFWVTTPADVTNPGRDGDLAMRFRSLHLTLSLDKSTILPAEPLRYTVALRNVTSHSLPGDLKLTVGENTGIWIRAERGDWRYYDGSEKGVAERRPRLLSEVGLLRAGDSRRATGVILATRDAENPDRRLFAFPDPGFYELKARVSVVVNLEEDPVVLESEPVRLDVEAPSSVGDRAIWQELRARPESGWLLQHGYVGNWVGDPRNPAIVSRLEELADQFPDSIYGPVLREGLQRHRDLLVRHKRER